MINALKTIYFKIAQSQLGISLGNNIFIFRNNSNNGENYFIQKDLDSRAHSDVAVILHLYHTDSWNDVFLKKLQLLAKKMNFDLYITLPEQNISHVPIVRKVFPKASFLVTPNRGRDVLPFIKTAILLQEAGYKKVLKLHSKKSTHRDDVSTDIESGNSWLHNTLNALIPDDPKALDNVVANVKSKNMGMIGAYEYYYPLKMYFGHNRKKIGQIMNLIHENTFFCELASKVEQMGYFGGTMFWVDLETIKDVLFISKQNFQKEKGQTDGTTAHALERVFCLMPQLRGKGIYGVSDHKVIKLNNKKAGMPQWYYDDVCWGKRPISIIVPVYSDWSSLSKNIRSLKKAVGNREDISVYYMNDCGPEADTLENKIINSINELSNFHYYRNPHNLGFVRNCNKAAFDIVSQNSDVLLLNSDTKVTKDFVTAMRKVLYSEDRIGAVTSRSNNATIWSVPMTGRLANHRLASYLLYRLIRKQLPDRYITPTIHGFCVLIRRDVIRENGLFDEVYGSGYGEENDFAMRIRSKRWKCAVANNSYVFHYESRSFGEDKRNSQIEKNEKILTKRYPEYRHLVQEYWDSVKEPLK